VKYEGKIMKVRAKPLLFPISITIKVDQLTRELLEKISEKRSVSISEAREPSDCKPHHKGRARMPDESTSKPDGGDSSLLEDKMHSFAEKTA